MSKGEVIASYVFVYGKAMLILGLIMAVAALPFMFFYRKDIIEKAKYIILSKIGISIAGIGSLMYAVAFDKLGL